MERKAGGSRDVFGKIGDSIPLVWVGGKGMEPNGLPIDGGRGGPWRGKEVCGGKLP